MDFLEEWEDLDFFEEEEDEDDDDNEEGVVFFLLSKSALNRFSAASVEIILSNTNINRVL